MKQVTRKSPEFHAAGGSRAHIHNPRWQLRLSLSSSSRRMGEFGSPSFPIVSSGWSLAGVLTRACRYQKGLTGILLLLCLAVSAWAQPPQMKVWAIGDNVRINPTSNVAYEDNPELMPEGLTRGYGRSNLIWSEPDQLVSLKAARNEIVAFQIVIERLGENPLHNVNVEVGEFRGAGGHRIEKENIDLYKEWYVRLRRRSSQDYSLGPGWYPDALLPCWRWSGKLYPSDFVLPFDIPDRMNNIGNRQKTQAMWLDIYVPRERDRVPAGSYESTITVSSDEAKVQLRVRLQVWDFTLPEENHLKGNIHSDTEINVLAEELELKYYQMMRRHRLALGVLGYAPEIEVSGTDVNFDWTSYDSRLGKYLDGSAFTSEFGYLGPGYGLPMELLILPFDYEPMNVYKTSRQIQIAGKEFKFYRAWPVSVPKEGMTDEYKHIFTNAYKAYQQHFDEHPEWDQTRLIVFFLSLDEAYDEESYEKMLAYARLLKESGASRLEFRIDGWYPMDVMRRLAQYVDIAILGGAVDTEKIEEIRRMGMEDWFYTGVGNMDSDPLGGRALSWFCWKYGISSWTLWELDFNALRAWLFPETYTTSSGSVYNGHGMLAYRGETMGLAEPAASIRLKILRRGAQDYEYFWLLSQQPGGRERASEIVDSIIMEPAGHSGEFGYWKRNSEEWERARHKAGDLIQSLAR